MTVRCFAILVALILTILSAFGCGAKPIGSPKEPPPPAEPTATHKPGVGVGLPSLEEMLAKRDADNKRRLDAEAALAAKLWEDPRPVIDQAVGEVQKRLGALVGDKKAKDLEVVADPEDLETFGGESWVVHGRLVKRGGQDSGRSKADQGWSVDIVNEGGKLRTTLVAVK